MSHNGIRRAFGAVFMAARISNRSDAFQSLSRRAASIATSLCFRVESTWVTARQVFPDAMESMTVKGRLIVRRLLSPGAPLAVRGKPEQPVNGLVSNMAFPMPRRAHGNPLIPLGEIDLVHVQPNPALTQADMLKMKPVQVQPVHAFRERS